MLCIVLFCMFLFQCNFFFSAFFYRVTVCMSFVEINELNWIKYAINERTIPKRYKRPEGLSAQDCYLFKPQTLHSRFIGVNSFPNTINFKLNWKGFRHKGIICYDSLPHFSDALILTWLQWSEWKVFVVTFVMKLYMCMPQEDCFFFYKQIDFILFDKINELLPCTCTVHRCFTSINF